MGPPPDGSTPPGPPPDGSTPPGPPPNGQASNGQQGQPPQGAPGQQQGKSASELTAAKVVDGTQATLSKTGDSSSADASNFTGQNAIFLAADSTATLSHLTLTSDADGANAVFATGSKAKVTAKNLKIHTKNNSSRGLDATYGGTIEAEDVDITTEGEHCAALATDRGEGTVTVQDGTFATSGQGSPNVYSTGNISVYNSKGKATASEIAVVEGKNSIVLDGVDLTGSCRAAAIWLRARECRGRPLGNDGRQRRRLHAERAAAGAHGRRESGCPVEHHAAAGRSG